jgi:hypothetical protein
MCHVWETGEMHTGFCWVDLSERDNFEDLGIDRRIILNNTKMDLREVESGGMDWIPLVQNRDRWRASVNAVMKLRVPWSTYIYIYIDRERERGQCSWGTENFGGYKQLDKSTEWEIREVYNKKVPWKPFSP